MISACLYWAAADALDDVFLSELASMTSRRGVKRTLLAIILSRELRCLPCGAERKVTSRGG